MAALLCALQAAPPQRADEAVRQLGGQAHHMEVLHHRCIEQAPATEQPALDSCCTQCRLCFFSLAADQLAGSALTLSNILGTGVLYRLAVVPCSHHEGNKAAVAPPAPLVVIPRPHDLDAGQGPKAPKLLLQDLLIQIWGQVACSAAARSGQAPAATFPGSPCQVWGQTACCLPQSVIRAQLHMFMSEAGRHAMIPKQATASTGCLP